MYGGAPPDKPEENWEAEATDVVLNNDEGWIMFKRGRKFKVEKIVS